MSATGASFNSEAWAKLREEIVSCTRCPRLVRYRQKVAREKKRQFMNWEYWGAPLPSFGDTEAELVILGLAPAAHGGNRTGRMFTGDGSADFLMRALYAAGFANQPRSEHKDDGLKMKNALMTAVVRCPPPQNKPSASEVANCRSYLDRELALLTSARVILTLGHVAFRAYKDYLRRHGVRTVHLSFKHGAVYKLPIGFPILVASYHPSRQNTQTGRLTSAMMDRALRVVKRVLEERTRAEN
jgi:uracil-DNA glycosylase family 4